MSVTVQKKQLPEYFVSMLAIWCVIASERKTKFQPL